MNILITSNSKYSKQISVLLKSIELNNPGKHNVYLMYKKTEKMNLSHINDKVFHMNYIEVDSQYLEDYPQIEKRYPTEIYYKLIAYLHLPEELDRILYLDPDIVVKDDISEFYHYDFKDNYFVATSHVKKFVRLFNRWRLGIKSNVFYINAGVMLMNLKELRKIDVKSEIDEFLKKYRYKLILPDQDILFYLYHDKTIMLDDIIYNLGERNFKEFRRKHKSELPSDFVDKNVKIIHYFGKNKPWKKNYKGILNQYYNEYEKQV